MESKRLKALYEAKANVHYKGKCNVSASLRSESE